MAQTKSGKKIILWLVRLSLLMSVLQMSLPIPALAQAPPPAQPPGAAGEQKAHTGGPRKQLATIIFAGLGGAILGLSTLSFYGRPQDYLANIPIGFAVGIITGTALVTYRAATNPQELYGTRPQFDLEQGSRSMAGMAGVKTPAFNLNFEF